MSDDKEKSFEEKLMETPTFVDEDDLEELGFNNGFHPSNPNRHPENWGIDEEGNHVPGTGYMVISAKRCQAEEIFGRRCIGVEGHEGSHWVYDDMGAYHQWWDKPCKEEPPLNVAASTSPDGAKGYVRPSERYEETHIAHTRWEPIDDGHPHVSEQLEEE